MRLRLIGFSGERPPVPGTEIVNPEDPEPGPDPTPDPDDIPPPLVLVLADGSSFHKADYLTLGYNRFDVMCIGGAGGNAGKVTQIIPDSGSHATDIFHSDYDLYWDSYRYVFGGAGGGGGVHRIKGRLALLPTLVPVVVGAAGANGAASVVNSPFHDWRSGSDGYAATPTPNPGTDGGASSFGGTICRASGGKGGIGLSGGAGGIGNKDGAGGGLTQAYTGSTGDGTGGGGVVTPGHMNQGAWDGKIGAGGAGANGTVPKALGGGFGSGGTSIADAVRGADGAYSAADPSVSGKGEAGLGFGFDYTRIIPDGTTGYNKLVASHYDVLGAKPGAGGGATAFPLTGSLFQYGSKSGSSLGVGIHPDGIVIVRLTYAIV